MIGVKRLIVVVKIGNFAGSARRLDSMNGQTDAYWSRDLITWERMNYQVGHLARDYKGTVDSIAVKPST
jgi:hypothetical protein